MIRDLVKQSRRSIRLTEYDYAQPGAYFITICTNNRECLFGEMADGAVLLNAFGDIAVDEWLRTAVVRHNVSLDAFVVMPNHLHGLIIITHEKVDAPTGRRGDPAGRPTCQTVPMDRRLVLSAPSLGNSKPLRPNASTSYDEHQAPPCGSAITTNT
jgi:hypothetical protein